jgi:hypothetical protein
VCAIENHTRIQLNHFCHHHFILHSPSSFSMFINSRRRYEKHLECSQNIESTKKRRAKESFLLLPRVHKQSSVFITAPTFALPLVYSAFYFFITHFARLPASLWRRKFPLPLLSSSSSSSSLSLSEIARAVCIRLKISERERVYIICASVHMFWELKDENCSCNLWKIIALQAS